MQTIDIQQLNAITMPGEVWKQIPDYNYLISNLGRVYGLDKNQLEKGYTIRSGYNYATLYKGGKRKRFRVSHLVAEAFCKNYEPGKHIHHINRNRGDDRAVNLLPCTPGEHRAIHALYNILFANLDILAELITPVNNLLFDDAEGGDAA